MRAFALGVARECRANLHRDGETFAARLERLAPYVQSTRYALTAADVRHDYFTGAHRYAL
jgi:hypothetical protein